MKNLDVNLKSKNKSFEISTSLCDVMYVVCPMFGHINCVYDKNNNNLFITSNKNIRSRGILKLYSLNLFSKKIKVHLPNNLHLRVKANLTSGNVSLNNLTINEAFINNLYGNVTIKESYVDILRVNGNDTKIKLSDVSGSNIDLYSEKGNINIDGILSKQLNAITNNGNINIKMYREDKKLIGTKEEKKPKTLSLSAPNGKITKHFYY